MREHRAELHARLSEMLKDLYCNEGFVAGQRMALHHAREAVRLMPSSPTYLVGLGNRLADDAELSVVAFTRAIALGGDDNNAYKERGNAFRVLNYFQAAQEDWLRVDGPTEGYGNPRTDAEQIAARIDEGQPGHADELARGIAQRRASESGLDRSQSR